MTDDPRTKPLLEWNRLARENTENAVVSSMFEAMLKASEPIETFSTWLLLATAAVGSFLIANAEKLLPYISKAGFVTCGVFLCVSCVLGLLSKIFAVRCKIGVETGAGVKKTFGEHLSNYKIEEEKIKKCDAWGQGLHLSYFLPINRPKFDADSPTMMSGRLQIQCPSRSGAQQQSAASR
jgi:hypothetical protein